MLNASYEALFRRRPPHLMPTYSAFSPVDFKLPNDKPFHTDAWIGAGLLGRGGSQQLTSQLLANNVRNEPPLQPLYYSPH